jgi:hypothetical protein|tara:strand:+ start:246 stop:464 length:219 start_codon:yes stop_codon:yes gene_type:complete
MIESVVALLLFLKGDIVEMTYKERMDLCLKSKRLAEREVNPNNVRFSCQRVKAETEIYMGAKKIVKIISLSN